MLYPTIVGGGIRCDGIRQADQQAADVVGGDVRTNRVHGSCPGQQTLHGGGQIRGERAHGEVFVLGIGEGSDAARILQLSAESRCVESFVRTEDEFLDVLCSPEKTGACNMRR